MSSRTYTINIPECYDVDEVIFKKSDSDYPKSWREYCSTNRTAFYLDSNSRIKSKRINDKYYSRFRNTVPNSNLARQLLAYTQLLSLRDYWIHIWSSKNNLSDDWKPDWDDSSTIKYCIIFTYHYPGISSDYCIAKSLSFPTHELANEFLTAFGDLLMESKDLI